MGLLMILTSSFSFSQPIMSQKEGLFFTLKVNNYTSLDRVEIKYDNRTNPERWFDLYLNTFDRDNFMAYRNDEFKWPQYSKSILNDMDRGIAACDFNKLYSFTCGAAVGKWNSDNSSFPITELYAEPDFLVEPKTTTDFRMSYSASANKEYFDFNLKMDQPKAEAFISSRKDNQGNVNRRITAKVIYNVVNKNTEDIATAWHVYLRIYIHKIIFYNGNVILGEIIPKVDFYDKINLKKTNETFPTVRDIDGNLYHTVKIGTQVWMVENLKTTKYNDGNPIPYEQDLYSKHITTPIYTLPDDPMDPNHTNTLQTYGALYSWYAVNTGKLAPKGWRVATAEDWNILEKYVGGESFAGKKLKEKGAVHWSNDKGTDEFGFCGFGIKRRNEVEWWTSTNISKDCAECRVIGDGPTLGKSTGYDRVGGYKTEVLFVRCVMDDSETSLLEENLPVRINTHDDYSSIPKTEQKQTEAKSSYSVRKETVTDIDGNVYHTITVGYQIWMIENLKTTRFNDGTNIPFLEKDSEWKRQSTPGYCWYGSANNNKKQFGALYNWETVNTGKLCPKGWHVPTDAEFTELTKFLDAAPTLTININGESAKTVNLWANQYVRTPSWDFDPFMFGGLRDNYGVYDGGFTVGIWWTSTENDPDKAWVRFMNGGKFLIGKSGEYSKKWGFSVRCIKDK